MYVLTNGILSPVSKTSVAILLLVLLSIGSVSKVQASDIEADPLEIIAATQPVNLFQLASPKQTVTDFLELPRIEQYTVPFSMPILDDSHLTQYIWKPEDILGESEDSQAHSRIPAINGMITSKFGYRKHPIKGKVRHHDGIDLAAKLGAPVFAPATGVVVFAGTKTGYGNVVEIDHQNGYTTLLAHHSKLLVKIGDIVNPTTIIANAGRTGIATGVHVHLEVRLRGKLINPSLFLMK